MKRYLVIFLVILLVFSFGCTNPMDSFGTVFDTREGQYEEMEKLVAGLEKFRFSTMLYEIEGTLKGKTHDVDSTITVLFYDEADFDNFDEGKVIVKDEAIKIFKMIPHDQWMEMESYRSIELHIKKTLVEELSINSRKLEIIMSDVVITER